MTGDIVYFRGKVAEYRSKFFPIYAAAEARADLGAPLLGSIPFVGVPGNHDLDLHDFDKDADLMAYYLFWSQPLNGPTLATGGKLAPPLRGAPARVEAFRAGAGERYPRMANFSFDAGDVHWTVLDSNPYIQACYPGTARGRIRRPFPGHCQRGNLQAQRVQRGIPRLKVRRRILHTPSGRGCIPRGIKGLVVLQAESAGIRPVLED